MGFNCLPTTHCFLSLHVSQRPQFFHQPAEVRLYCSVIPSVWIVEGSGSRRTSDPQSRAAAQAKTSLHARSHMLADDAAKRQLLSDDENRDSMVDGQKI